MDPDENLKQQIRLANSIQKGGNRDHEYDASTLADLVLALHEWIEGGGFLPAAWRKGETK